LEKTQSASLFPSNSIDLKSRVSAFVHTRIGTVLCLLLSAGLAWFLTEHVLVTTTPSLSQRVFWRSYDQAGIATVKRGDYVIFDQYLPEPRKETRSVIKRVACGPGDTLSVKDDYYYCNGQYLGMAKHKTIMGSTLTPFVYNGVVPKGSVFALGDHKDSYDCRYYGFKDISKLNARAWAIF
jgi:signal peptidase I/conjugal transfer pilin signal peptidase TrbI